MNRVETEIALNNGRTRLLAAFVTMDEQTLLTPVTESAFEPGFWWTPKDHFAHLIRGELSFCGIVSAFADGHEDPIRAIAPNLGSGAESPIDYVNRGNDEFTREHRHLTFSELVQLGEKARSDTFELLARLTDEQFELKVPNAPWSGGTVGAILAHNASDHAQMHWDWMAKGWTDLGVPTPAGW